MTFTDAARLWGRNENTLRKAIAYGKQRVISTEAVRREYGRPKTALAVDPSYGLAAEALRSIVLCEQHLY